MKLKNVVQVLAVVMLALVVANRAQPGRGRGGGRAVGGGRGGAVVGPFGGGAAGGRVGGTVVGPGGSVSAGRGGGSAVTPGGATINYGGAGGRVTGPGGGTAGRGVGGVQVTTPGGKSYTKVGTAGGAVGPGGRAVAGKASVGVASGPGGTAVSRTRAGVATGPAGTVAGGARAGAAIGPYGAYGASRYAAGARGAVGHRTYYVATGARQAQAVAVRRGFVHYNVFRPTWFTAHPAAWRAAAWTTAAFWTGATWAALARTCGYPAEPYLYDYGTTIVYEGNQVYYDGEPVATAQEYADQATAIANVGQKASPAADQEWAPLGVFGMVQGNDQDANTIFQLAINKDGIIRGNYFDALTDTTLPVYGSVQKSTQRAAWTVGDRKEPVFETGIGNLTQSETAVLVHFGPERTQQWTLIRLEAPPQEK
jgi:hypothetical protein